MNKTISIITLTLLLNGCTIYRSDVQQGNALNKEAVAQLQRGMSKAEVASLMGTPLLQDNFRSNRWDYVYYDGKGSSLNNRQNLTLIFQNDLLTQVRK